MVTANIKCSLLILSRTQDHLNLAGRIFQREPMRKNIANASNEAGAVT
jgi:hypothetical protein